MCEVLPFLLNCCQRVAVHFLRDTVQESLAQAEDMAHELLGSEQGQTVIMVGPDADIPADWGFDAQRIGVLHLDGDPQPVPVLRGQWGVVDRLLVSCARPNVAHGHLGRLTTLTRMLLASPTGLHVGVLPRAGILRGHELIHLRPRVAKPIELLSI